MKILHTEASLGWGGQEIRVLAEARGVMRAGHSVLLAAPEEARISKEGARFGVPVRKLPIGRKRLGGVRALRHLLAAERFDVVNTHSSTDTWLAALACASIGAAPPLVRTRHISAPMPRNFATRWLYRRATDRIVTTGERLRMQVMAETGVAADRVVSIPTGIDLERFRPGDRMEARQTLGLPVDAPIVGIVATLRSWKGHPYLFDAIAAMDREVRLVVVGDGPQREALEARAREADLAGRVTFAGNRDDVAPWMHAFDVFCLPSYANEGVPQALMQAMACGLPVVTTPVGSIEEIVEDCVTGILVAPQDAQALRNELEHLLRDDGMRAELSERAAARARDRFGEALMVERMLAVFREAAGARNKMAA